MRALLVITFGLQPKVCKQVCILRIAGWPDIRSALVFCIFMNLAVWSVLCSLSVGHRGTVVLFEMMTVSEKNFKQITLHIL